MEVASLRLREKFWRKVVIAVAILVLIACGFRAILKPYDGDFKLHWESGRRFLAAEFLYAGGHNIPYPPFWAMAHAPASLLPLPAAKAILFPCGIAALVSLIVILRRLTASAFHINATHLFWVTTFAIVMASTFILRDMAELGVNTLIVMLSWQAIWLWQEDREWLGGFSLGLATALKCTPAIFVGYFLWKRQWRMAAISALAAGLFSVIPIVRQGPDDYVRHIATWAGNVWLGATTNNPSMGVLGPEPLQNLSLRPALARYLVTLPADHPGRAAHPFYFDIGNLDTTTAAVFVRVVLLLLIVGFLWWSRSRVSHRDDPRLLWELAALSLLMLLISPVTWGQHCVAILPACFFVSALIVKRESLPPWMFAVLTMLMLFVLILNRDLIGRSLTLLLGSYHVTTFVIVGLLAVTMRCRGLVRGT